MFEAWDTSRVVIFAIGENINQLSEFIDVFGMRCVGLIDDAGVYTSWRVPNPVAPYPQDYIIDQQGIVRYWSDEFDAQAVMNTIDRLLATGVTEGPAERRATRDAPRTFCQGVLHLSASSAGGILLDASGREATDLTPGVNDLTRLSRGVYFVRPHGATATTRVVLAD